MCGSIGSVGPGATPTGGLDALRSGRITDRAERLKVVTTLLEASFYEELYKAMRDTVPDGGLVDGGAGEDVFSSLMDQHMAEASAARSVRGLGDALYRQFADVYVTPDGRGDE